MEPNQHRPGQHALSIHPERNSVARDTQTAAPYSSCEWPLVMGWEGGAWEETEAEALPGGSSWVSLWTHTLPHLFPISRSSFFSSLTGNNSLPLPLLYFAGGR